VKRASAVALLVLCPLFTFTACHHAPGPTPSAAARVPHFELGGHQRKVSTTSPAAQEYFNQGLSWTYGFNHDEAIRCFNAAAAADPQLAMAHWGVAYCYGPHINFPILPEDKARAAWAALTKAQELRAHATPVEQALIDALTARYANPAPADRSHLDKAYAAAMKRVHEKFPSDQDVAVLYAESMMDLQPWDLWTNDGKPKGNALEIVSVLEEVLRQNPRHPGATHFYIHALEASRDPGRAMAAADTLRTLVPISGHLRHMPSHTYARVGKWYEAAAANREAIKADKDYYRLSPRQNFYMAYMQHNHGFLAFACTMLGRSDEAIKAAREATTILPPEWIKEHASIIDGYLAIHMDALKRFGKWDEILALPAPPAYLPFTTAMWRANRAIAYAAKGQIEAATTERAAFDQAVKNVPKDAYAQKNPAHQVLDLAANVVDGEIAFAKKDHRTAIEKLTAAAKQEDNLHYIEPPDWIVPVRHTLGAVYLDNNQPAEAERTYREDLARLPNNGWSLLGLSQSLAKQGKADEAARARMDYDKAWAKADCRPLSSCACATASD
jgi:tetratricopeptide (TPR) repeat protein